MKLLNDDLHELHWWHWWDKKLCFSGKNGIPYFFVCLSSPLIDSPLIDHLFMIYDDITIDRWFMMIFKHVIWHSKLTTMIRLKTCLIHCATGCFRFNSVMSPFTPKVWWNYPLVVFPLCHPPRFYTKCMHIFDQEAGAKGDQRWPFWHRWAWWAMHWEMCLELGQKKANAQTIGGLPFKIGVS